MFSSTHTAYKSKAKGDLFVLVKAGSICLPRSPSAKSAEVRHHWSWAIWVWLERREWWTNMAVCQNLVPLVNIKIAGKWMFIPLKMVLIGIDPYPYGQMSYLKVYSVILCVSWPKAVQQGLERTPRIDLHAWSAYGPLPSCCCTFHRTRIHRPRTGRGWIESWETAQIRLLQSQFQTTWILGIHSRRDPMCFQHPHHCLLDGHAVLPLWPSSAPSCDDGEFAVALFQQTWNIGGQPPASGNFCCPLWQIVKVQGSNLFGQLGLPKDVVLQGFLENSISFDIFRWSI